MKAFILFGLVGGLLALAFVAWNTVDNMRFAKYEPGWVTRQTWLYDRVALLATLAAMAGLVMAFAEHVQGTEGRVEGGIEGAAGPSGRVEGEGLRVEGGSR